MRRIVGVLAATAVFALAGVACGGDDSGDSSDTSTSSSSDASTTTGAGSSTTAGGDTTTTTAGGPPSAAPAIDSFDVGPAPVNCSANSALTVSWATQNASGVDLSIDGPGVYSSYGPSGSTMITFPCDGNTHSYLLTAHGEGGQTATRTVTVSQLPIPM